MDVKTLKKNNTMHRNIFDNSIPLIPAISSVIHLKHINPKVPKQTYERKYPALHYTWYHIKHYIILLHSISSYKVKPSSCVSKWTFDQIISLVLMTCCFTAYLNFRRLCIDFCANVFRTVCTCIAYLNQPKMFLLACCCHINLAQIVVLKNSETQQ